ncbi:ATP-binding protein [Micromonospora sp. U21]|uniref:ATP-binding protein n=1 Tax=Micromonospora sp. U21 TaxID=2824899 RepID=UPI001B396D10|nr:ATP-binding protein [Micromonospora sp. U21]MBQ0903144.1 ATP-binding protein [Micromonospora sp. U21]
MTPTPIPPCWSRAEIQVAAQVDAGGLEFGDPAADAVFSAVHQSVPLARRTKAGTSQPVTEKDVLADLCQALTSNEPHIRFITGRVGTGKSHLVRWLRVHAPRRDDWHFVYIEKRNTSLRRIIEQVLDGIDTPTADNLRTSLARAASRVTTVPEAMLALLNHLHRLVEFDDTPVIQNLAGADLLDIRQRVARLVGDYTFKQQLSRPGGPIERIAKLAKDGHEPGADVNAEDLHISEADLKVSPEAFLEANVDFQSKIRQFVSNRSLRSAAAAVLDYYLPRATAEVFTGSSTDLLQVFEDVRGELARRGHELFLFIEDLVLLHGIDAQLAQALTVPARADLCPIRAAIAVTSGYLDDRYATFADRGVHYTMDVDRTQVNAEDLRSFVGRYLNVGRVGRRELAGAAQSGRPTPNKCTDCVYRDRCHPAFGVTREGHGLFPFNAAAVDHLVALASPRGFDPRNILREVIREPLEVAEAGLARPGEFPSARFAAGLAPTRMAVPVEQRDAIARQSSTPQAEISLRAFYAANPPAVDDEVRRIADILGVHLTELGDDNGPAPTVVEPVPAAPAAASELDQWAGGRRMGASTAQKIRRWILDTLAARLQNGPHGLSVKRSASNILVGPVTIKPSHVIVENAAGGGSTPPDSLTITFSSNDRDAVLLKGVVAASSGDLAGPNGGRWFFEVQHRLARLEAEIVERARHEATSGIAPALAVLGVLSTVDDRSVDSPAQALAVMIWPKPSDDISPGVVKFLNEVERYRTSALAVVRDSLTQRKGGGAPSIFDAGAILTELVRYARLTQLPAELRDEASARINVRGFHEKQSNAADTLWKPVRDSIGKIGQYVAEGEDLRGTLAIMDKFVEQAHRESALARPDAKEIYDRSRAQVTDTRLSTLRRITGLGGSASDAGSLWHLLSDPLPVLTDMIGYWRLCDQLLRTLRDTAPSQSGASDTYDRARLQRALRGLADTLEGLIRQ